MASSGLATKPMTSFRAYIEALREDDDLVEIDDPIDPDLEAAAISRLVCETNDKAPLFNNVIGARDGLFRILGAPAALRRDPKTQWGRVAHHYGLPVSSTPSQIAEKMISAADLKPIEPIVVETGPVLENAIEGDDIDLNTLPLPHLHAGDGGKYIQSFGMNVMRMPDGKWTNWSISRAMVNSKRTLVSPVVQPQHIWQVHKAWKELGKDAPFAIAFGVPPVAIMVSGMPVPDGVSEAAYAGALANEPLRLVKCGTNDLHVPADSEILFEGTISATETALEGPFGEFHGYTFLESQHHFPVFKVSRITYRNQAILPICVPGRLTDETQIMIGVQSAAQVRKIVQQHGLPILDVSAPMVGHCIWLAMKVDTARVRAEKIKAANLAKDVGDLVFRLKPAFTCHRIILVGEDIDIFKDADVLWAFATRCRPGLDEYLFEDISSCPLVPFMAEGTGNPTQGGKVVHDALFACEYTTGPNWETGDFEHAYPPSVKAKVLGNWGAMGFRPL